MSAKKDDKKNIKLTKVKKVTFNEGGAKNDKIISSSESESGSESSSESDIENQQYEEVEDDDTDDNLDDEIDDDDDKKSDGKKEDEVEDVADGDDDCVYRFNKKKFDDSEEEGDFDDYFDDDKDIIDNTMYVPDDERITKPILTKFERVRLLSERTAQLAMGAKPMLKGIKLNDTQNPHDPKEIAKMELINKVIPIIIIRTLPTGRKEKWRLKELAILN